MKSNTSISRKQIALILGLLFMALVSGVVLVGCGGAEDEGPSEVLEDIVVASPTSAPTATPIPTATAFVAPTEAPEGENGSVLSGLGGSEEGEATPEPFEEQAIPLIEPQVVSINFRQGILNDWIEVVPPPGWILSKGLDGILVTQNPGTLPENSFILVRRWGNFVNLSDWVAYMPDGFEERDSNVTIRMGGFDWDGVFITNETNSYRAFFAVSNSEIPAYTLLVYVPIPEDQIIGGAEEGGGATREAMLAYWETTVGDLNTILRRFLFR